jgi:tetratricopeptide (TPR) repeat protein
MSTISLVMIVKNEERCLARCLASVQGAVDEIVVVDTGSTDATADIARRYGASVPSFTWIGDFSAARNYGIERAKGDWILVLDADEYFDRDPSVQLRSFIGGEKRIGRIMIKSRFIRDGQEHTAQSLISRIFPRSVRYAGIIHEQLASDLPRVDSGLHVLHDGYFQTNKSDRNIKLLSTALAQTPEDPYLLFQLAKEYKGIGRDDLAEYYYKNAYSRIGSRPEYAIEAIIDYLYVLMKSGKLEEAMELIFAEFEALCGVPDFHFVRALIFMETALRDSTLTQDLLPEIERAYLQCLALGQRGKREIVLGTSSYLAAYNLAVFYELSNRLDLAKQYYSESARLGYQPAKERLVGIVG